MRAAEIACHTAAELVRNARAAIATSEQRIRSTQRVRQSLRSTWAHRAQLRAELYDNGDQGSVSAETDPEATAAC
jgi:hypothetical protein